MTGFGDIIGHEQILLNILGVHLRIIRSLTLIY